MSKTNGAGGQKCRYDLYDQMPAELRVYLQNSAFNWATKMVHDKLTQFQNTRSTLRSLRSKEAARIKRDARLIWNRETQ